MELGQISLIEALGDCVQIAEGLEEAGGQTRLPAVVSDSIGHVVESRPGPRVDDRRLGNRPTHRDRVDGRTGIHRVRNRAGRVSRRASRRQISRRAGAGPAQAVKSTFARLGPTTMP